MKAIQSYQLGIILLILVALLSFKTEQTEIEKEYMTIVITSNEAMTQAKASISVNGDGFVREELLKGKVNAPKGAFDYNSALTLLVEYQRGGWQVVSNNLVVNDRGASEDIFHNYFFLVREKPIFKRK